MGTMKPIVVGISGASGAAIARRTVEALLARDVPVALVCSNDARLVWQEELDEPFSQALARWREHPGFTYHAIGDMKAPIASGTYPTAGMAIVPCSMATVAAIANGLANNLLLRAADVTLKEQRRLVVVPRETPLSAIHLENLLKLARLGVVVMPPEPAFYLRPKSIEEIVDFTVGRVLVALGIQEGLEPGQQYRRRTE
jgi:4-hydroxy-3-polyprenylbenzoate decarboxylase